MFELTGCHAWRPKGKWLLSGRSVELLGDFIFPYEELFGCAHFLLHLLDLLHRRFQLPSD